MVLGMSIWSSNSSWDFDHDSVEQVSRDIDRITRAPLKTRQKFLFLQQYYSPMFIYDFTKAMPARGIPASLDVVIWV